MKVLLVAPQDYWLPAMESLEAELGWTPVYWLVTPQIDAAVKARYPETIRHDVFHAVKGVPADTDSAIPPKPLDQHLLREYAYEQSLVLEMMSRLDVDQGLTYRRRVRLFHEQLSYWLGVVAEYRPDIALFAESPHSVFDYVLYAVCRRAEVRTVLFSRWAVEGQIYALEKFEEGSEEISLQYDMRLLELDKRPPVLSPVVAAHLQRLRGDYKAGRPGYMVAQHERFDRITQGNRVSSILAGLRDLFRPTAIIRRAQWLLNREPTYDILLGQVKEVEVENYRLLKSHLAARLIKRRLRNKYEKLVTDELDLSTPYIYCALHYQPERTTAPDGESFVDQMLMLRMISSELPSGWTLVVKDHVTQFLPNFKGERGRQMEFYDDIASLHNTVLLPLRYPSFELIDHSQAVATVTGTVGWEALVRGKPALVFGHAWYKQCHGAYYTPTLDLLKKAIDEIGAGRGVDRRKVDLFAEVVDECSTTGAHAGNDRARRAAGITPEDNGAAFVAAIRRHLTFTKESACYSGVP